MKVCLATVHANPDFTPLALLYLKATLVERLGMPPDDVQILEFTREAPGEDIAARILTLEPDVLGLSCYVWNIKTLTDVARRVTTARPGTHVVLGGPEVGPVAASVLRANPAVDVIVNSEGEGPFAELVSAWRAGAACDSVRGITWRRGADIVETEAAPIVQRLDELPSPHRLPLGNTKRRAICIETQRGCVFRCNFCFYNKDFSIRNRRFDLNRVKEEIRFWLQQEVGEIYLMDPIFNLHAERAKEICRFIAQHNTRHIPVHAEIWAEFVDDEMARLMSEANFQFLEVGLQSVDDTVLATAERRLRTEKFLAGVRALKVHRLVFELQLIYGLPGDTLAAFRKSLNFAAALDPPQLAVFPLMVLPGTELWRKAAGLRLEFDPEPPYFVRSHYSMSAVDIAFGWKLVEEINAVSRSKTFRYLGRERGLSYADVIEAWMRWQEDEPGDELPGYRIKQFVIEFCARNQIPSEFYRTFVSWEYAG